MPSSFVSLPPLSDWLVVLIYVNGISQYHILDFASEAVSCVLWPRPRPAFTQMPKKHRGNRWEGMVT